MNPRPATLPASGGSDKIGLALVAAQTCCLATLVWPGRAQWAVARPARAAGWLATAAGAAVATSGARSLGPLLSPLPAPPEGAVLRTDGPYAELRHPIYAGLLLGATGVALARGRREPVLATVSLLAVLHVKAGYEERLLREFFGAAYVDYAARVPRLVPRVLVARLPAALRSRL